MVRDTHNAPPMTINPVQAMMAAATMKSAEGLFAAGAEAAGLTDHECGVADGLTDGAAAGAGAWRPGDAEEGGEAIVGS